MAGSLNKVMLIGNLGADPEVRTFNNGGKVANIRIATSENWKDKNTGEKRETTEWHSIAFHGDGLVGVVEKYLTKGDKIYVEGQLKTRKWQDQSGNDRYSTEILVNSFSGTMKMLSTKRDGAPGGGGSGGGGNDEWGSGGSSGGVGGSGAFDSDLDDDVPF